MAPFLLLSDACKHALDGKPWLVHTTSDDETPGYLAAGTQAAEIMNTSYVYVKVRPNTPDYMRLRRLWPGWFPGSFVAVDSGAVYSVRVPSSERACLRFLVLPKEHAVHQLDLDFFGLLARELADESTDDNAFVPHELEQGCMLSIRLMHGETAKAFFSGSDCLMDVKRWLHRDQNLLLIPEEDESFSKYVYIGHYKPSRYAFFSPAARCTFSEAEEFLKLSDLGLCPRLALILRPDYDANAIHAARAADERMFKLFFRKCTALLQAVYSFFDYGVDEASRDIQDIAVEHAEHCDSVPSVLGIPGLQAPLVPFLDVARDHTLAPPPGSEVPVSITDREPQLAEHSPKVVNIAREGPN